MKHTIVRTTRDGRTKRALNKLDFTMFTKCYWVLLHFLICCFSIIFVMFCQLFAMPLLFVCYAFVITWTSQSSIGCFHNQQTNWCMCSATLLCFCYVESANHCCVFAIFCCYYVSKNISAHAFKHLTLLCVWYVFCYHVLLCLGYFLLCFAK